MWRFSGSSVAVAILFAIVSIVFYTQTAKKDLLQQDVKSIIHYWKDNIAEPASPFKSFVVGINCNVDIIVPGVALLKILQVSPGTKKNHESLSNLTQLEQTFSHFLSRGSAAERSFLDQRLYKSIIKASESLDHVEYFVGGNAALIAKKAAELFPSLQVQLVGAIGPILQKLLPESISIDPSSHTEHDEFHLIMEYSVGETWGDSTAPVANRFVTSFDETNSKMLMMEPLFKSIHSSHFDIMVLSGLHMMDGLSSDVFQQRLDKLVSSLKNVPKSTVSHLEFASMANQAFVKQIMQKVMPNINSLGLNEQELVFSSKSSGGPHSNLFDDDNHGQPELHKISDILLWLMKTYGHSAENNPTSKLSRIHFHSLTYHVMAVLDTDWSNTESAVAAGARTSGLQACHTTELTEELVSLRQPKSYQRFSGDSQQVLDPNHPVVSWRKDGILFVFSPVLVCKHPLKTVGLGDAISATGLMFSQHKGLL